MYIVYISHGRKKGIWAKEISLYNYSHSEARNTPNEFNFKA